jgi:hypothetical protein
MKILQVLSYLEDLRKVTLYLGDATLYLGDVTLYLGGFLMNMKRTFLTLLYPQLRNMVKLDYRYYCINYEKITLTTQLT